MDGEKRNGPRIPHILLTECCGAGTSSKVWLGKDRTGRSCAVRLVSKRQPAELLAVERQAVALYQTAGSHSHLLRIREAGETADYLYTVTDPADNFNPVPGPYRPDTLAVRLGKGIPPLAVILSYLDDILAGMEQLHDRQMAHGDLKPENILFVRNVLKIGDPGLVGRADLPVSGGTAGFRPWWGATGREADIYAVGKLIYLLFTRQDPARFPEIPPSCRLSRFFGLNEIALRCCERSVRARYRSMSEIRRDLTFLSRSSAA